MEKFDHKTIEQKWAKVWKESQIYRTPDIGAGDKEKMYILDMFPYPSGTAMHVGHAEGYIGTDIVSRFSRMKGKDVLHPMGWDAFGLPAENFAIKTGVHPRINTDKAIQTFIEQLDDLGLSYDWEREIGTHRPEYYKWTQWFFLLLYKKGLAYKKEAPVNWCDSCKTTLANEQVVNGVCERCDTPVVQKNMSQWFFKITAYADQLIQDLKKVDWPESTKTNQINWIGKSEGALVKFKIKSQNLEESIEVFTTAHDTIFGATFLVIAPEHVMIQSLVTSENKESVNQYIEAAKRKTELERTSEKDKTGVFTGSYAINPVNGAEIPIWVADYVLVNYGTGAVMGVPGGDERDGEFAQKYNLPVIYTSAENSFVSYSKDIKEAMDEYKLANSGKYNGITFKEARPLILKELEENGVGKGQTNYKLRDWLVSRQRYWGAPIPIVYDPEGNPHPVDESDLPVILPDDIEFLPTGESPLKYHEGFHKSAEEKYGKGWRREVDTMDTFVDSSWYFFRFADPNNDKEFASKEAMKKWCPVDFYVGGAEHTVLHLMYARFFTKVLRDEGFIDFDEPFMKLRHQGMILGEDSRKMSKRWGNVVDPRTVDAEFGIDTLRVYEMFMGPFDQMKPWSTTTIQGVRRFLDRVWFILNNNKSIGEQDKKIEIELQKLTKKVTEDIEEFKFNTAVAEFMKFVNFAEDQIKENKVVTTDQWNRFLILLAPFAPFITEELYSILNSDTSSIHTQPWPMYDPALTVDETVVVGVQVNGKVRGQIEIGISESEDSVREKALQNENVQRWIEGKEIKKFIYVAGKIVNIVI